MPSHAANHPNTALLSLSGRSVLAALLGAITAFGVAWLNQWAGPEPLVRAAALALVATLAGAMVGLLGLAMVVSRDASLLGFGVVLGGVSRMLVALAVAVLIFLVAGPEGRTFWAAFLLSNLLCLTVETAWGMAANARLHGAPSLPRAGASA